MVMVSNERRAVAAGDEELMEAVECLRRSRRSYAAGRATKRAEIVQAIRELLVSECNALNTRESA